MITHTMPQGSAEWLQIRSGIPTASEFDALISPLWKPRESKGVETYLHRKLAERWLGRPMMDFGGFGTMEQGKILEEEAIPYLEFDLRWEIERVGFITTDDKRIGCSPDILLADGGGEIKCPQAPAHCGYLMEGILPKDYAAQVHGSMLVTGAKSWHFVSYCRGFPLFLLEVQRDEKVIEVMQATLDAFNERLDRAYARLVELNGGEPKRLPPHSVETQADGTEVRTIDGFVPDEAAFQVFLNIPFQG